MATSEVCAHCGHRSLNLKRRGSRHQLTCSICDIELAVLEKAKARNSFSKGSRKR